MSAWLVARGNENKGFGMGREALFRSLFLSQESLADFSAKSNSAKDKPENRKAKGGWRYGIIHIRMS